jgi:PAS domain S-box-containing protein
MKRSPTENGPSSEAESQAQPLNTQPQETVPDDPLRDPRLYFYTAIEQVKDYAIFTMDLRGYATTWNSGVERLLGFSAAEFVGHEVAALIFTAEAAEEGVPQRELNQAAMLGQSNNDRWMQRSGGQQFYATGVTTGLRDAEDRLVGYIKVMRDQTQWKQLQSQLQKNVDELAQVDRKRIEFLAVLAHELRNPLAPLRNAIDLLPDMLNDRQKLPPLIELMGRQIRQMSHLIEDLMDMSRVTQGKIELRRRVIDVNAVVEAAIEATRHQFESAAHELALWFAVEPLFVYGDEARLSQVVTNLINNACKFTPANGRIQIFTEADEAEVLIHVRDTGIGLTAEEQATIFEMFTQIDSSIERTRGGLGVGLTLVRKLVELHGGSVQVYSSGRGEGSEFVVRLPRAAQSTEVSDRDGKHGGALALAAGYRILIVDDNKDAADSLAMLLELKGHVTGIAHDGLAALRCAADGEFDLVLLDIGLPNMSGYEVARRIRATLGSATPTLVALTGWGQDEDRRQSAAAGFDEHWVKPFDQTALDRLLMSLPKRREM